VKIFDFIAPIKISRKKRVSILFARDARLFHGGNKKKGRQVSVPLPGEI
jgi:hypothetical protein